MQGLGSSITIEALNKVKGVLQHQLTSQKTSLEQDIDSLKSLFSSSSNLSRSEYMIYSFNIEYKKLIQKAITHINGLILRVQKVIF